MQIKNVKYLIVIILLASGCTDKNSVPDVTKMTFTFEYWDWNTSFNVTADSKVRERELATDGHILQENTIITPKALNSLTKIIYRNAKDSIESGKLILSRSALRIQIYQEDNVIMDYYLQDSLPKNNYLGANLIQEIKNSGYCVENAMVLYYLSHYRQLDSVSDVKRSID